MKTKYFKTSLKKLTFIVAMAILAGGLTSLNAQEVLLGTYEFTTGDNQTKPSNVQTGVQLSDVIFTATSTTVTATYANDAIETTWNKAINFGNSNCLQFYLKNGKTDVGFDITRIEITVKRTGPAAKFRIAHGNLVNPNTDTYNSSDPLIGLADYATYNFNENTKDPSVTGSVSPVAPVFGSDSVYIAIATTSNPNGSEIVSIDKIEVFGYLPKFHIEENFSNYSPIAVSGEPADSMRISDDVALSQIPGWTASNLYAFVAGAVPASSAMFGITATDSAYLTTPALDLTQPFNVSFKFRSRMGPDINPDGRIKLVSDNNVLVWEGQSTATVLKSIVTEPIMLPANTKLTFTCPMVEGNQMIVDDVKIYQSFDAGINLPFNHVVDFGVVNYSSTKALQVPILAYNLKNDLTLTLKQGTSFTLGSSTIAQATAIAGTDLSVSYTAPAEATVVNDTLLVMDGDVQIKQIFIKAEAGDVSAVPAVLAGKISIHGNTVLLSDLADKQLQVYTIAGLKVKEITRTVNQESIMLPSKGAYILRLRDNQGAVSTKVLIQ
ncbi:MAG: T9SS type A sorting domain-containing protein [Bacteroidales bacterium]|jgi:hypothetical protein